jgi:hypothetical protein
MKMMNAQLLEPSEKRRGIERAFKCKGNHLKSYECRYHERSNLFVSDNFVLESRCRDLELDCMLGVKI